MNVKLIGKHEKDSRACRDGLALTLDEMMAQDKSICYVDCDLMGCINTKRLREHYPDRAFEAGIAEGNAAGVSAGLAATGKKVFFHSFGTFSSRRCYDQIYMSAAYAGLTVHVLGSDAGVTAAFNGGTHMPLEDAAMYLSIPETTVLDPADYDQLASITRQLVNIDKGVTYTRFVRKGIIQVYGEGSEFEIGKGVVLHESDKDQATIITSGIMVDESLKAYEALQAEGISVRVIDMFTWKPLDEELVVKAAKETGAIVEYGEDRELIKGADALYTDIWASMGEEDKIPERVKLLTPYKVTGEVLKATENPDCIFLHCLPSFHDFDTTMAASQKELGYDIREVTDEVFLSSNSKVFDEAENRMHTIKAVMVATIGNV